VWTPKPSGGKQGEPLANVGSTDARCREWLSGKREFSYGFDRNDKKSSVPVDPDSFDRIAALEDAKGRASFRTQSHLLKRGLQVALEAARHG
jgi:hypothetical protein